MSVLARGWLPLGVAVLVGGPVWWAWPADLDGWRRLAIVSGWSGCGLLWASLVCMLREPWLARRLGGLERMYTWHHGLGVAAYLVLLVHPVALALANLRESPAQAWATLSPAQQGWPEWLGWMSLLAMMIGLWAALSPRLPYARWRGLHALLALSVVVGLAHLWRLGLEPWLLWTPLLAVGVLVWRVARADGGLASLPCVVTQVRPASAHAVEVTLRPVGERRLDAAPGQFVLLALLDGPNFRGCREHHPFTLTAIEADGRVSVTIKALGDCTRRMQQVEPGTEARLQGPFGAFGSHRPGAPQVWVAGGIGIAPFVALLRAGAPRAPTHLVYLYRHADDATHLEELGALAAQHALLTLDARGVGDAVPDLSTLLPDAQALAGCDCHLCGPAGLVQAAVALLRRRGVPAEHIHFERFDFR